jgi:uncharacterized cupredoxin-like copper-binding protein
MSLKARILATALAALLTAPAALADSLVRVTLIDKAGAIDPDSPHKLGMGMKADMSMAKMGIKASPSTAKRGAVTFDVTNLASAIVHEVIVVPITDENKVLPFDESRNKVDTDSLQPLGSVNEIEPNKTVSLTLNLGPGKYLLYCNIAGHYMAGMWTVVTVE